jgi:hypothetical protein
MEHLLTVYIRTKLFFGDKDGIFDDGTVVLKQKELMELIPLLEMEDLDEVNNMLDELKREGQIKGYGSNYKTTKKDGVTQPGLLEVTGVWKKKAKQQGDKATRYAKKVEAGIGSKKFKKFMSSKPMDKYFK